MNTPLRETILVIDDQEENLRVVGTVLSLMNYDIVAATSAEQAIKRLQAVTPDLILLDVMMPETDGLAVCRLIKQNPNWVEIPIIFLSASDDKNVIVQALEAGGVDYVTKPFNRAELLTRVRTHLSLKNANDRLRRLAEDKDVILGILAHDLKNGIAGIQLSAELLQGRAGEFPERSRSLLENMGSTSVRLLDHIKKFLANQRAEHHQVVNTALDLVSVIGRVVNMNRSAAEMKNITLTFTKPAEGVIISGDEEGLVQSFDNLISNAIKFSPVGGKVEVEVSAPHLGRAKTHVRDSGPGFSSEDRGKLFQRYQRLSARPTANEPSTGLGLSITQRLLVRMNGDIQLADAPSSLGGAEFVVSLGVA